MLYYYYRYGTKGLLTLVRYLHASSRLIVHFMLYTMQISLDPRRNADSRFVIKAESTQGFIRTQHCYPSLDDFSVTGGELSCTLTSLMRDTEYTIWIKQELSNFDCGYYAYIGGNYSDPIHLQTNVTRRYHNIQWL